MCIRVEGLLVSDASSSRSFIYAEVCQIVNLFSLNTWCESIENLGYCEFFFLELCIAHPNHLVQ